MRVLQPEREGERVAVVVAQQDDTFRTRVVVGEVAAAVVFLDLAQVGLAALAAQAPDGGVPSLRGQVRV